MTGFYPTSDTGIDHSLDVDPADEAPPDPAVPTRAEAERDAWEERERAELDARAQRRRT